MIYYLRIFRIFLMIYIRNMIANIQIILLLDSMKPYRELDERKVSIKDERKSEGNPSTKNCLTFCNEYVLKLKNKGGWYKCKIHIPLIDQRFLNSLLSIFISISIPYLHYLEENSTF
ncbi:hypothetical protein BpHYR1_036675 [Brachionus plicatilis]|uniref:Uncharacterized protein n=1 Tax=Brachionus plicatilis TaxID=10195 RepID=A0A3M7P3V0_BRAPC|nr:hypothetical protein BpHYR1_036675 [Brachionus plicatilis]